MEVNYVMMDTGVHNTGWNEQDSYLVTCKQVGYRLKEDEVFGFGLLL